MLHLACVCLQVNSFEECVVYIVAAVLDLMWLFKGSVLCIEHYSLGGGGGGGRCLRPING